MGNYLYVAGGRDTNDVVITSVERYDPFLDEWTSPFEWANATSDGGAFGAGDLLYLVGGYDAVYNTLAGLTAINTSTGAVVAGLPDMTISRGDLAVVAAADGE